MKIADHLVSIFEKAVGDWKPHKEFEKFGGNYINHTYKHKKSDAEVHFIKDNVLEPTVKGKILLIIPSKKVNKELEWGTSKDKSFFNDAEIKAGLKKADKELSKLGEAKFNPRNPPEREDGQKEGSAVITKNNAGGDKGLDLAFADLQNKKVKGIAITPNTALHGWKKLSDVKVGTKVAIRWKDTKRGPEATVIAEA